MYLELAEQKAEKAWRLSTFRVSAQERNERRRMGLGPQMVQLGPVNILKYLKYNLQVLT